MTSELYNLSGLANALGRTATSLAKMRERHRAEFPHGKAVDSGPDKRPGEVWTTAGVETVREFLAQREKAVVEGRRHEAGAAPAGPDRPSEILVLMAKGLSNAQIGAELGLSADTVKTHAKRLYARMGVGSRAEAVAAAYERGLIVAGGEAA